MVRFIPALLACMAFATVVEGADPAAVSQAAPGRGPAYPFAMCSNGFFLQSPEYPIKMLDAGARMIRLDVSFQSVRPKPGDDPAGWNWKPLEQIRAIRQKHPELEVLPILGYGPEWAQDPKFKDVQGGGGACPQRGVEVRPVTDPRNLYGHFVYEAVKRYKDVIHHWESWNEPDLPGHAFFKGNGRDFFQYQRVFYLAAKAADPQCTVSMGGLCFAAFEGYLVRHKLKAPSPSPPTTSFLDEYLEACSQDPDAAKHNYYCDVMNQHTYSRASDLYDYIAVLAKAQQDYLGTVKPVWVSEMGSTDKGGMFGMNGDEYCDYALQSFAWAAMAGVERLFFFQLDNSNGHGLYLGLMGSLGQPKPVLTTYRDVLAKEFADARFVAQLHGTKGVDFLGGNWPYASNWQAGYDLFEFKSRDGRRRILMAFADTDKPAEVTIPATPGKKAVLIDRHNVRTPLAAKDGVYRLNLAGATHLGGWPVSDDPKAKRMGNPEHLVGGATQIIVEQ